MSLLKLTSSLRKIITRQLSISAPCFSEDLSDKRRGHLRQSDRLEGESGTIGISHAAYELIDEKLMDRVIENTKFKDIPFVTIRCTRNNTKVSLRHANGSLMVIKTAGTEGYKHCRKGTTVAAQAVANRVVSWAKDHDVNMIRLVFNGLGPGRGAAYQVFEMSGLKVVSLSDRTEAIEPWRRRPRAAKSL